MQKNRDVKESSKKRLVLRRESIKNLDNLSLEFGAEPNTNVTCAPSSNKPT